MFKYLLGKRIRELRTQQGRSQKEFADSCGIPGDRLERIEQGEIDLTLYMLVQLAQNLQTEAHAILMGSAEGKRMRRFRGEIYKAVGSHRSGALRFLRQTAV